MRYHVKERVLTLKDDFVVRDEKNNVAYVIKGQLFHIGDQFRIIDATNDEEVITIKQRVFDYTTHYDISSNGAEIASLHRKKEEATYGARYEVSTSDGMVLQVQGQFKDWDFNIIDHYGRLLGHITKEFAIFSDHYTVDVAPGVDGPFLIALAVILDEMREDGAKD
ncbi:LURP-one-related/scramblase family protein [Ktedonospora formicarum]|uniref:LURP-one-related family protein n=1 Tax=Ktedonospora formicarum TaxID=2778364 RepID=A0A8J3I0D4_9CHLR|nr:LURP-one-related family protein [Ktedonospora formicarum]GHO43234.1 hypothetical protein KSX_13970 [Ktedonospora formicarum]